MKRTELKRRARLRPVSRKGAERRAARREQQQLEGAAFKQAVSGDRCCACGRTEAQARADTGHGHHAHHVVRQEVLRRLGLDAHLWDPDLAAALCEEPCHRRHTSRKRRVPIWRLPVRALFRCSELGVVHELLKEHPA